MKERLIIMALYWALGKVIGSISKRKGSDTSKIVDEMLRAKGLK